MFAHGASEKDKVDMYMYDTEHEDFSKGEESRGDSLSKRAD
jgi:hypothetical protein